MPTILSHPKIHVPNSSSNQFNIPTFSQHNNPTLIPLANNYLLSPILCPWSTWIKGTIRAPSQISDNLGSVLVKFGK